MVASLQDEAVARTGFTALGAAAEAALAGVALKLRGLMPSGRSKLFAQALQGKRCAGAREISGPSTCACLTGRRLEGNPLLLGLPGLPLHHLGAGGSLCQRQGPTPILGYGELSRQHDLDRAPTIRTGDPGLGAVQVCI